MTEKKVEGLVILKAFKIWDEHWRKGFSNVIDTPFQYQKISAWSVYHLRINQILIESRNQS
jgi:hypothetical protein